MEASRRIVRTASWHHRSHDVPGLGVLLLYYFSYSSTLCRNSDDSSAISSHDWDDVRGKFEISKRDRWRHNDKLWYRNNRNAITISCDGACSAPNSDGRTIVRFYVKFTYTNGTRYNAVIIPLFFFLFVLVRCSFHTLYCCENSFRSSKGFRIEKYFCAKPCVGKWLYRVDVICNSTMTYCDGQRWRWWFYKIGIWPSVRIHLGVSRHAN